jgi:hypothetical protein
MSRFGGLLRSRLWLRLAGLTAVLGVGVFIGVATTGRAASTNTCGGTPTAPTCFSVTVDPPLLSPGATGLVVAKFRSQGPATTNHTFVSLTAPVGATPTSISADLNGTALPDDACTLATLSCAIGQVPGFGVVRVFVMFTSSLPASSTLGAWSGTLAFDEGGQGNDTNSNDTFTVSSSATPITDGTSQLGLCTQTASGANLTATGSNSQITKITSISLDTSGLPCTAVAAGVRPATSSEVNGCGGHACVSQISFATFPLQPSGNLGKVSVLIPASLITGPTKNVVLYELPLDPSSTAAGTAVAQCPTIAPGTDSCIDAMEKVKVGGIQYVEWDLLVQGSPVDGRFGI